MKRFWIVCFLSLMLVGCSNGPEAPKEGRIGIGTQPDKPAVAEGFVKAAAPGDIQNWSAVYANRSNNRPHAILASNPKLVHSISIGKGVSGKGVTLAGPVVVHQTAYTLDSTFTLQATNLKKGERLWRKQLAEITGTTAQSIGLTRNHKNLYAVAGNGLIVVTDFNGKEIWRKNLNALLRSSATVDNGRLFVSSVDNELFVLDAKNGDLLWKYTGEADVTNFFGMGTPAVNDTAVVMTTTNGRVNAFDIETGILLWTENLWTNRTYNPLLDMTHITTSPVIEGKTVYLIGNAGKSGAYLLDNGTPIFTVGLGGRETPALSGDSLFLLTNQNTLVALNKKKGTQYWETSLVSSEKERPTWYGPVLAGDSVIVVSSNGDVVFYDLNTGKERQRIQEKPLIRAPVFANNAMLLMTKNGRLHVYR